MLMMILASLTPRETTYNDAFSTVNTNFVFGFILDFVSKLLSFLVTFSSKSWVGVLDSCYACGRGCPSCLSFDYP